MIVTVNSQRLAVELRLLAKVVPNKPAIPILSHVLVRADTQLSFLATDLEVALTTTCQADVQQAGEVALPGAKLLAMVEQFADGDVTIARDKDHVVIRCGTFRSRLMALRAEDYPKVQQPAGTAIPLPADALALMIGRTRYAVNPVTSKHVLQGALLVLQGPVMVMVATDAKRLALTTAGRDPGSDVRVVLPMKTMDMLASQLSGDVVDMTIGERHLHFQVGDRLLTSRTIDGTFPAYEKVFPQTNDRVAVIQRSVFSAALKRVLVAADDNRATYFTLESGKLTINAASAEVGAADETVPAQYNSPDALKVCASGAYVLDFLGASSGQNVTVKLKDTRSAMLLMDGDDHLGVVMLMRA